MYFISYQKLSSFSVLSELPRLLLILATLGNVPVRSILLIPQHKSIKYQNFQS